VKRLTEFLEGKLGWLIVIQMLIILNFLYLPASGANQVDFQITGLEADTFRVGVAARLDVWIENDYILGGMNLGVQFFSPDGANWKWDGGFEHGASGIVSSGYGRMGDGSVFDMTGLLVTEQNIDETGRDTIMCGGVASESGGLQTGPLEHMYSMHFTPHLIGYDLPVRTLCFDSAFVPPFGSFVFVDAFGNSSSPVTLWPSGGRCYPVGWCRCSPPDWDDDLPTEMAAVYGATGSVFLSAFDLEANQIIFGQLELTGGSGEAVLDDHGDGTCEVFYTPVLEDTGQEITIAVYVRDDYHYFGARLPHVINVVVTYNPLSVDCGWWYLNGATNNPITKTDILVPDDTLYENLVYSIVSGPGEIDSETGQYSWFPGSPDTGVFTVEVEVDAGGNSAQCSFQVDVADENCCPGDASYSGTVDVGDAVFLVNYIFKGGSPPLIMNWADANADCEINVGDVVYLINYVFRSGDEPLVGCYY
jgi:hypothetical protein